MIAPSLPLNEWIRRLAMGLAPILLLLAAPPAAAAKPTAPPERIVRPMRVAVVQLADPACGDTCPRWISAEGDITAETPALFRAALKQTDKTAAPVFIRSNGGSVEAALTIGRMLRKAGRDIAVTSTRFDGCAPGEKGCKPKDGVYRGQPVSYFATCMSACSYLIAGAKRRFVSAAAMVGVHRIELTKTMFNVRYRVDYKLVDGKKVESSRTEVSRSVASEKKSEPSLNAGAYADIRSYLTEMGVSQDLVTLSFSAAHDSMHIMRREELLGTRLMSDTVGGEWLVGRARVGFEEFVLPEVRSTQKPRPYAAWLAAMVQQNMPLPRAALQLRVGGHDFSQILAILEFSPNTDAETVTWHAWLMRAGEFVNSDYATMSLETPEAPIIAPTVLESSITPGKSHAGVLPVATFCLLKRASGITLTFIPVIGIKFAPASRTALPWVDRELLDRCDAQAPTTTTALR